MPTLLQQLKAIILLPGSVTLVVPFVVLWLLGDQLFCWQLQMPFNYIAVFVAAILIIIGVGLAYMTIRLFIKTGQGTIVRWNPPRRLIVEGPYRYVRNPMISGIIFVLLGESLLFMSVGILGWAIFFFISNHFYFIYSEEPDLEKRFGDEYRQYLVHVPRWLPRWDPWNKKQG